VLVVVHFCVLTLQNIHVFINKYEVRWITIVDYDLIWNCSAYTKPMMSSWYDLKHWSIKLCLKSIVPTTTTWVYIHSTGRAVIEKSVSVSWCMRNSAATVHPVLIWNNGALGFLYEGCPNKKNKKKNKMSSDMRSVPDLKISVISLVCGRFM